MHHAAIEKSSNFLLHTDLPTNQNAVFDPTQTHHMCQICVKKTGVKKHFRKTNYLLSESSNKNQINNKPWMIVLFVLT